jgi:uncharacterized protein (DUF58 family)
MFEFTLTRKQLFILPTRTGMVFALMLLALFGVAMKYANQPAFLMTFLLASLGQVSTLYTHRNLLGLVVGIADAAPVFAGETAEFPVEVVNHSETDRSSIYLFPDTSTPIGFDLGPNEVYKTGVRVITRERGYLPCPDVRLTSQYPIGLLFSWTRTNKADKRCLVYPRPAPYSPLPATSVSGGEGAEDKSQSGNSDYAGLRPYQEGDSPRHMHWRVMARQQEPVTKMFEGNHGNELFLNWADTGSNDIEERISLMCRWVLEAERAKLSYALQLPGNRIPPGMGRQHQHECLKTLALWR